MSLIAPTAVVAEDEAALRGELVEQLGRLWPELSVVGEAADGLEALRLLDQHRPDILFLDIEMPGATGIDVARQVNGRAHVVFLTAYDQYAVAAFDQGAVDYLLKPLNGARLFTAISRLKARLGQAPAQLGGVLDQLSVRPAALDQRVRGPDAAPHHGGRGDVLPERQQVHAAGAEGR
jgi:DNA-binding LytR/AlgR family response regulator